MKTIRVAKTAGFCFGVERAVNKVYEQAARGVGPLIYTLRTHHPQRRGGEGSGGQRRAGAGR